MLLVKEHYDLLRRGFRHMETVVAGEAYDPVHDFWWEVDTAITDDESHRLYELFLYGEYSRPDRQVYIPGAYDENGNFLPKIFPVYVKDLLEELPGSTG